MRRSAVTPGGHLQGRHFEPYFGGASAKIYTCFERKRLCTAKFSEFRANGGEVNFFDEIPKDILG